MVGRTLTRGQPGPGLGGHLVRQHLHQARFADAGFAAEQHHLAEAVFDLCPALTQQPNFLLPPHQRGPPGAAGSFQATAGHTLIEHAIDRQRLRQAFQERGAERLAGKEPPEELKGRRTDHQGIGRGEALQAGRQVGGLAEGELFLARPAPDVAHHHQPGMDPQAHSQVHPPLLPQMRVELAQGLHDPESSPHGPLGVVLVRQGVAEVDKQAVAEILGDMPLKAGDHLGAGVLIGPYDLAQVFWVELAGQGG